MCECGCPWGPRVQALLFPPPRTKKKSTRGNRSRCRRTVGGLSNSLSGACRSKGVCYLPAAFGKSVKVQMQDRTARCVQQQDEVVASQREDRRTRGLPNAFSRNQMRAEKSGILSPILGARSQAGVGELWKTGQDCWSIQDSDAPFPAKRECTDAVRWVQPARRLTAIQHWLEGKLTMEMSHIQSKRNGQGVGACPCGEACWR